MRSPVGGDELGQARFVDRHATAAEQLDLVRIHVEGDDFVTEMRHAGGRHQAYVSGTDNSQTAHHVLLMARFS